MECQSLDFGIYGFQWLLDVVFAIPKIFCTKIGVSTRLQWWQTGNAMHPQAARGSNLVDMLRQLQSSLSSLSSSSSSSSFYNPSHPS